MGIFDFFNKKSSAEDYFQKSGINFQNDQIQLGIENLTKAIELDPKNGIYFYNRGTAKKTILRYKDAIPDLTKSIELKIDNLKDAYFNRAMSKLHTQDIEGAYKDNEKAKELGYDLNQIALLKSWLDKVKVIGYETFSKQMEDGTYNLPPVLESEVDDPHLFKRDLSGLQSYFKEFQNMERIFNELTSGIRNGISVREYLAKANLLGDNELKIAAAKGFNDVSSFLIDMLDSNENSELRTDYNACIEAVRILDPDIADSDEVYKDFYENGKVKSTGYTKNEQKHGLWKYYYENGELEEEGRYKNGMRSGTRKSFYENGKPKTEGDFENDMKVGFWKGYNLMGQVESEGNYKNSKKEGLWKSYLNGKIESEANYKNDKRDGIYKVYDKKGDLKAEAEFIDDKREGLTKSYQNGIIVSEETFKNDERNGLTRTFVSGIIKEEVNYKDGKLNGAFKTYHKNGKIKLEQNYVDDEQDELVKLYDEEGELINDIEDINLVDKDAPIKTFHKNGKIKSESYHLDGVLNGVTKSYYENGELEFEANYKNDKLEGVYKGYYKSGKIKSFGNFKEGKEDGDFKEFYENSFPATISEKKYKNGNLDGWSMYKNEKNDITKRENWTDGILIQSMINTYYDNRELEKQENFYYKNEEVEKINIKTFYKNGNLESQFDVVNGKINGVLKAYRQNGKLERESNMKDGIQDGLTKVFDSNGNVVAEGIYKNGEVLK